VFIAHFLWVFVRGALGDAALATKVEIIYTLVTTETQKGFKVS
jgi:hypothetical protein